MHWLSLPLVSCLILALSSCPAHSQSTSNKDNEAVVPLIYNDNYAPEVLDLLTQGILKYGIFNTDIKKHPKLQQRLDKTVKGLKLDLGVGILGNTVKVDLGLGQLKSKKEKKSKPRSLSTRHASNNNLQHSSRGLAASHETHHHKEKRLLGLEVGLTGLIGGGGTSDNDDSLISVELGLQTIVDDGWNDAVTTRLMNSGNDNAWLANITFGTPPQRLSMFIDSGSADTTVFDPSCTTCGLSTRTPFHYSSSTTFTNTNKAFSTGYGDGTTMQGFLGKDKIGLSLALNTNSDQLLGIITSQFKGSGARLYDGILGIGPDHLSFVENNITPFSKLVKENKITRPLVGIALVRKGTIGNLNGGGEFRWGSLNTNYINGPIIYTPVTSNYYWGINIQGIYVNNLQMYNSTEPRRAIIDTGTTLVYVSNNVATNIHSKIPGSNFNNAEGAWYVPCDITNLPSIRNPLGDPNIFFEIGNHRWGIPIKDLAFRSSGRNDNLCISGIQGGSNDFAILGDVFIKNRYLVLSFGNNQQTALQVGLANRTDIPPIL